MKKLLVLISSIFLIFLLASFNKTPTKVVGEYENIDNIHSNFILSGVNAYEIGADKNGMPIFKDTDKAFKQAKIDFADGFKLVRKQHNLMPVNKFNYSSYKTYGWQTNTDDENIANQCGQISTFFDFYENSFE